MIQETTIELLESKLEKGLKKAKDVFPEFNIIELGHYKVKGSKGNWYEIRAGRTPQGLFFIACPCRGALQGHGCYHGAVAFIIHQREMATAKKKAETETRKPDDIPYLKGGSDAKPEKVGNIRI